MAELEIENAGHSIKVADYALNAFDLLNKKLECCSLPPITYELKSDNLVIELNTASFELVKNAIYGRFVNGTLQSHGEEYHSDITEKRDQQGLIENDVIRVYRHKSNARSGIRRRSSFVITLFRTKSKILVNGHEY